MPRPSRTRRAFTLVEAIAAITVLAVIAGGAATMLAGSADRYAAATVGEQLSSEASAALDRIARELQAIPADPAVSGPSVPQIASVTTNTIAWGAGSSLYLTKGGILTLVVEGGAPRTLLANVGAFDIRAFDQSNLALGPVVTGVAVRDVRRLLITITVTRQNVSETLRTKIFIRSTMSGAVTP